MTERRPMVQLESPFGAPDARGIITNVAYALIAMHDSLSRGEAPFASHLLYTQVFDDADPEERQIGIEAGLRIGEGAELTAVYGDLGISRGMQYGIAHAEEMGRPVEQRLLYPSLMHAAEIREAVLRQSPLRPDLIRAIYARHM